MAGRNHLSIGEVLSLLQEEFPDVTISKIRFLEAQGLVDPERTPSGYRKFYEQDIERLRWVLRQQRDAFLPLKVIKGRLEGQGTLALEEGPGPGPAPQAPLGARPAQGQAEEPRLVGTDGRQGAYSGPAPGGPEAAPQQVAGAGAQAGAPGGAEPEGAGRGGRDVPAQAEDRAPGPGRPAARGHRAGARPRAGAGQGAGHGQDEDLPLEELLASAGVDPGTVEDLERYGLIAPRYVAGTPYYPPDAVVVARLAAAFSRHGVGARHLRAYKGAAEREAGMVQQVVMPLIKQRNPEARRAASRAVEELSALGAELRAVLLRAALADLR